jgi:hypothetical protein
MEDLEVLFASLFESCSNKDAHQCQYKNPKSLFEVLFEQDEASSPSTKIWELRILFEQEHVIPWNRRSWSNKTYSYSNNFATNCFKS